MGLVSRHLTKTFGRLATTARSPLVRHNAGMWRPIVGVPSVSHSIQFNITGASSYRFASSQAAQELSQFLVEEIKMEQDAAKERLGSDTSPDAPPGFQVQTDGAEVKFWKEQDGYKVTVTLNVNDSVDESSFMNEGAEEDVEAGRTGPPLIFRVEITKGTESLAFDLQALDEPVQEPAAAEGEPTEPDAFTVEQICIYRGDSRSVDVQEKTYRSSGAVLDGDLYACLLNYLHERGVNRALVDRLTSYADHHEHNQYVGLLQKIHEFVQK